MKASATSFDGTPVGIFALLLATACATPETPAAVPQSPLDQIVDLLPGLEVTPTGREPGTASATYDVVEFDYTSRVDSWPYGRGLAVFEAATAALLWIHLEHGDFPPHPVHWADFDGDGRDDIFFLAGIEDVSQTYVFVNRVAEPRYSPANFVIRFHDGEEYAVVLDFDADGNPELLVPEPRDDYDETAPSCSFLGEGGELGAEWSAEYDRIVGDFDAMTFRFGSAGYRDFVLRPADKIRIASLHGPRYWATADYPAHLARRVELLRRARPTQRVECEAILDETIRYLESQTVR